MDLRKCWTLSFLDSFILFFSISSVVKSFKYYFHTIFFEGVKISCFYKQARQIRNFQQFLYLTLFMDSRCLTKMSVGKTINWLVIICKHISEWVGRNLWLRGILGSAPKTMNPKIPNTYKCEKGSNKQGLKRLWWNICI